MLVQLKSLTMVLVAHSDRLVISGNQALRDTCSFTSTRTDSSLAAIKPFDMLGRLRPPLSAYRCTRTDSCLAAIKPFETPVHSRPPLSAYRCTQTDSSLAAIAPFETLGQLRPSNKCYNGVHAKYVFFINLLF